MCHILVVDDDIQSTRLLFDTLFPPQRRNRGWRFTYAEDGQDAMLALMDNGDISVVVTDLAMPGSDGFEVMRFVQRRFPLIPVIVCSGYSDMPNIRKAMNLGAFDFLIKPFVASDFEATVSRAMAKAHADASTLKRLQTAVDLDFLTQRYIADLHHQGAYVTTGHRP